MDQSGSPETAGAVAWAWTEEVAKKYEAKKGGRADLSITSTSADGNGVIAIYDGSKPVAVATLFRDPMNFTILVRWMDDYFMRLIDDRIRCGCSREVYERVQAGGVCGKGGCPYGGDL